MRKPQTKLQISAGGVAFRKADSTTQVAIVSVGEAGRWQLPKGIVDENESTEETAVREVREEAGIETEPISLLDKIEYWYTQGSVRYHKFVYFYLLRYTSGDVSDHDAEVNEARWVGIDSALRMLAFRNEKAVVQKADELIRAL